MRFVLIRSLAGSRTSRGLTLRRSRLAPSGNGLFHKFGPGQSDTTVTKSHGTSQADLSTPRKLSPNQLALLCRMTHTPLNKTTRLQQALVARLKSPDDCRYDPSFRYGNFLFAIPRRLGRNKALDAATAALLARHAEAALRQDQTVSQAPVVAAYGQALSALRTTLDEPDQASSIETICAILILTFCQVSTSNDVFWN